MYSTSNSISQETIDSIDLWSRCSDLLATELSSQQFNTWIKPLYPVANRPSHSGGAESNEIVLIAPNRFIRDWVIDKFLRKIQSAIDLQSGKTGVLSVRLEIEGSSGVPAESALESFSQNDSGLEQIVAGTDDCQVDAMSGPRIYDNARDLFDVEKPDHKSEGMPEDLSELTPRLVFGPGEPQIDDEARLVAARPAQARGHGVTFDGSAEKGGEDDRVAAHSHQNNILRRYRFDNFVEGKSNQLARAAAIQVVENPSGSYNPLFLYGGVGLGKTHLMHAVGNEIKRRNPGARVVYLHSERFVGDMVKALQLNAINDFKRYYRSVDALLIDDIQFFANKERSQEEFFHTFNALLEGGQQMIFSCDRYPKSITGVEERLKSRFGWGLTVHIEAPELETRVAILKRKAEQESIDIPDEAAFFLASKVRANVRELEGALKRVNANAEFLKAPITVELIKDSLKDLLALQDKMVTIDNIQRTAAEYFKIKIADLHSKRRNRSVARPRQVAMALAKELTQHSLPEIGDAFGGRDHTTVLHACKKVKELRETNADVSEDYHNLIRQLST